MVHLPIALQLYSVREDLEKDFAGTIRRVKALGYDGVEFAGLYGHKPEEVKAICEEVGITPISAHVPFPEIIADPEAAVAAYAAIGVRYVVIPYLPEEYRPGTDRFAEIIEMAKTAGAAAKKYGMMLGYHNHDFEFVKLGDKYALDVLYDSVPADLLETQLDVCWVKVGGECPVKYIHKYAGRTHIVHLKDFVGSKSANMYQLIGQDDKPQSQVEKAVAFEFRPVGKGVQDFPPIIAAAEEVGAQWFVVEQDMPSMGLTPMECAKASIEYLKSLK